jgi:hypothetical protein
MRCNRWHAVAVCGLLGMSFSSRLVSSPTFSSSVLVEIEGVALPSTTQDPVIRTALILKQRELRSTMPPCRSELVACKQCSDGLRQLLPAVPDRRGRWGELLIYFPHCCALSHQLTASTRWAGGPGSITFSGVESHIMHTGGIMELPKSNAPPDSMHPCAPTCIHCREAWLARIQPLSYSRH